MHAGRLFQVPKNIAEEIIEAEAKARQIVHDARSEGARIVAQAKTEAEELSKESRQKYHRTLRDTILQLEEEAEKESGSIIEKGRAEAGSLVRDRGSRIEDVASWAAGEVIARYGSSKG
jgi:vacuolar-type H+-ATPase subunit H